MSDEFNMVIKEADAKAMIDTNNELRAENEKLKAEIQEWREKAKNWINSPDGEQRLGKYREQAKKIMELEEQVEQWKVRVRETNERAAEQQQVHEAEIAELKKEGNFAGPIDLRKMSRAEIAKLLQDVLASNGRMMNACRQVQIDMANMNRVANATKDKTRLLLLQPEVSGFIKMVQDITMKYRGLAIRRVGVDGKEETEPETTQAVQPGS